MMKGIVICNHRHMLQYCDAEYMQHAGKQQEVFDYSQRLVRFTGVIN
jgi:hypothetical protein